MPCRHWQLAGDDCRMPAVSVFKQFKQFPARGRRHGSQSPVVKHDQWCFGKGPHEFSVLTVGFGDQQTLHKSRQPHVQGVKPSRQVLCARAQARKLFPTPVGPVMRTLWPLPIQAQEPRFITRDLARPFGVRRPKSSMTIRSALVSAANLRLKLPTAHAEASWPSNLAGR